MTMYESIYYLTALLAVTGAGAVLFARQAVHAALYLIVALLAIAVLFFLLGAPLLAAMQVILYVGAIMVLFLFLMMVMNLRARHAWPRGWLWPLSLTVLLLLELAVLLIRGTAAPATVSSLLMIAPDAVGVRLFGPYLLMVELVALLLLAALVAVLYLSRKESS